MRYNLSWVHNVIWIYCVLDSDHQAYSSFVQLFLQVLDLLARWQAMQTQQSQQYRIVSVTVFVGKSVKYILPNSSACSIIDAGVTL
jgi:hypothetical protein